MSKLIVVISGKKSSGKDTFANMLAAACYNLRNPGGHTRMCVVGGTLWYKPLGATAYREISLRGPGSEPFVELANIKILAFADSLKQIAMDLFGLTYKQCYGTDAEKNWKTNVMWDDMPFWVRMKAAGAKWWNPLTWGPKFGFMTGREFLQIFGTEIVRRIYPRAWARALYVAAERCKQDIVFVPDCRFPNELTERYEVDDSIKVYTVRLRRVKFPNDKHPSETALDNYSLEAYDVVLHPGVTLDDMWILAEDYAAAWMEEAELIAPRVARQAAEREKNASSAAQPAA